MIKIIAALANGFEEIEAITPIDIWRRAGFEVETVSIDNKSTVTGSHNITITADTNIIDADFNNAQMIFLPGGMPGAKNLDECTLLKEKLLEFNNKGKTIGAICAAPMVLGHLGILEGKKATCYPGIEQHLSDAEYTGNMVETHQNIVTAKGVGAAIEFALKVVEIFKGETFANELATKMQVQSS